jgi:hypothetical protein
LNYKTQNTAHTIINQLQPKNQPKMSSLKRPRQHQQQLPAQIIITAEPTTTPPTTTTIPSDIRGDLTTNISHRPWKRVRTEPAKASIIGIKTSWHKKQLERKAKAEYRQLKQEKLQHIQLEREAEKLRRAEKTKLKAENEFKAAKLQHINPEKLKTMSKKQLRMVKKTQMGDDGVVRLVGIYD